MGERRRTKPRNNVYTVLVAVALVVLIFGAVYVWLQIAQMTGETNPFEPLGALPAPGQPSAWVSGVTST